MLVRRFALIAGFALLSCFGIAAQDSPAAVPSPTPAVATDTAKLVEREFGPSFTIDASSPTIYGDFDGDGVEDMALVAAGKNPLTSAVEYDFKVIDPYNAYFGYGDPKVTMTFGTTSGKPRFILILHSWQSNSAKPKFVVANLPFEHIEITHTFLKVKKQRVKIAAVSAEEEGGLTSMVYWDGKKYKWQVTGSVN